MAPYQYQLLKPKSLSDDHNAIRIHLPTLLPGFRDEQVCCPLQVAVLTELVDDETYEALSCCWGTDPASMSIQLSNYDDEEEVVRFDVRPNLHAALCAFRLEDETQTLWIDAICINQENNLEKNTQLPLMRRITKAPILHSSGSAKVTLTVALLSSFSAFSKSHGIAARARYPRPSDGIAASTPNTICHIPSVMIL
jgi:hypothetical protein